MFLLGLLFKHLVHIITWADAMKESGYTSE